MTVASRHLREFVDHLAEALDDPESPRRRATSWAAAAALLAVPLRPDDQVASPGSRRSALPPAHPARAGGVPDDHHRRRPSSTSRSRRATARTRRSPGRSPGRTARRRRPGGASPGTSRSRRPATCTSTHPASLRLPARDKVTPMDLLTRMVEHHIWLTGEMVRLAERAHRRAARPADRARRRRRPADDPLAAVPADRPDGHVERRDGHPRLRLVGRGARVAELDACSGSRPRARRTSPTSATWSRATGSTTPSSTRSASRPRCSPTAG